MLLAAFVFYFAFSVCVLNAATRPNIIWLVAEDMGPELGCYGDRHAITPQLDKLAGEGVRFTHAFTHAPVCAPSRSGLITGMYPTTIGTHHMRSKLVTPPAMFTSYLRRHGYYVAWPGKTDFNFDVPPRSFDSTSNWLKHPPPQPFFAYLNFATSHESQIRASAEKQEKNLARLKTNERHAPEKLSLPPYYPDTAEVRRDLANYYDLVTAVDYQVGDVLAQIERHGWASNTVIFFFGDHGRGLPRAKRWVYDTGIRVPLLVRWPGKLQPGTTNANLVSFIDFAPTVLALAGVPAPAHLPGVPFFESAARPRKYVYAARDRMDETHDRIRAVRDERYKYIRNFHPELPYAQRISYMELMPTMQAWRLANAQDALPGPGKLFFANTKPPEELYDSENDPYETVNLAKAPAHQRRLENFRSALDQWMVETKDLGAVPEKELVRRGLVVDTLKDYEKRKVSSEQ